MFLRSLTLKGFKSFADTTVMHLEPGVTVVVGPNGSGKSNVVDAIAWVLGAQAPSAVRSQKMDDVIFAGTSKRSALGRAEVGLTIDNSAGLLPIEFNEVTITRTLFRTGESEYSLNGTPCRLLDVQDLLSDSGVGRQQHVIISQGQIDAVLNARPEDRRGIIEEAAGVLKYRKRKERAERRLEATEANLLRVQDLLREVRRQLRPLERQADAARRHGEVVGELKALQLFLSGREIAGLQSRLTALSAERGDLNRRDTELRTELARLDTDVLSTEARLSALGGFDLGDSLVRVEQLRERARGLAAVLGERRRAVERGRGSLMDTGVVANLEADAARMRTELDEVDAGLERLAPAAADLAEEEQAVEARRAELEAEFAEAEQADAERAAADAAHGHSSDSTGAHKVGAAEIRGELRTLRSTAERGAAEAGRLDARLKALEERVTRLDSEAERFRGECAQASEAEAPLVEELTLAETARGAAEAAFDAAEQDHRTAQAERSTWQARADALALALDQARARAGAEKLAAVTGVIGTLLDLVEVDEGWSAAFEAAAGEALSAVVVDGLDAARRALTMLHSSNTPGAVLALGSVFGAATPPPVGEPVRRHVRSSNPSVERLLDAIVGGAVAVDGGWTAAVDTVLAHPEAVVVTRDGDRFGAQGWRVGEASAGATGAALEEATGRAQAAHAELAHHEERLRTARSDVSSWRQRETELTRRLDANDGRLTGAQNGLNRAQGERREAGTEAEALAQTRAELAERLERERARIVELESLLPSLEANESAQAEAARRRREARARLDAAIAAVTGKRRDLSVRAAALDERKSFLTRRMAEVEARLTADGIARSEAAERRQQLERTLVALDRLSAVLDTRRTVIDAQLAELQERRRLQSEEARAVAQALDGHRKQRAVHERSLEGLRERERRAELDEAEVKLRLEQAVETLRRDHDTEPEVAMVAEMPPLAEGTSAPARVRDLERELRIMGPINPLALEEFNALQERHTFLEAQLEDVRSTRRELGQVIKAVDTEIQSVFAAAYADVADNFTKLFGMLFPGGLGKLHLTNPDDLLNTGIEVEAKPSGKNVKKLSLLSGGERSLTALAFLFAVFRSRPSPFYVMDEVEAALDDVNLHRFLSLVDEFRQDAQLLIVTHQKRTMEAADCLFGVTMQPGGSSRVVSEKVRAHSET